MNRDDWDEPVVLGEFEPEPGPESLKDMRRMRADAKALLAQQDAKTGVDYVTDRVDRYIKRNPAPEFKIKSGLRPPEEKDPVWFYVVAIIAALLGVIGAIGYAVRGVF